MLAARRKARRPYSRTGLNALKTRVKVRGLEAIDRSSAAARALLSCCAHCERTQYRTGCPRCRPGSRPRAVTVVTGCRPEGMLPGGFPDPFS